MAVLCVLEQGATIHKKSRRLIVRKDGTRIDEVPLVNIEQVIVVGVVHITTPTISLLLDEGIDLVFLTSNGRYRGRLVGDYATNPFLLRDHVRSWMEPAFSLMVARACVSGKLRNARTFVRRLVRSGRASEDDTGVVEILSDSIPLLTSATNLEHIRGIEGRASAAYFSCYRKTFDECWAFDARTKRPATDRVNALLNLGYALLRNSVISAVQTVGMNPYLGFLHAHKYGRPALALDLMEEFRPVLIDPMVLSVINKGVIKEDDFTCDPLGQVSLGKKAFARFVEEYYKKARTPIAHPTTGSRTDYLGSIGMQARLLAKAVQGEIEEYTPFVVTR